MQYVRVIIAEDSVTQREILRQLISRAPGFLVVGEAKNGRDAVQLVARERPDVVLMDIHMPDMNGVEATREIMQSTPTPIVVASASLRQSDVDLGLEALKAGAVSVIEKPIGPVLLHLDKIAPDLLQELRAASEAKVVRRGRPSEGLPTAGARPRLQDVSLIAVAASTGGPAVLTEILSSIPKPYPLPILLVQHISEGFVEGFAKWLGEVTGQAVGLARNGQEIRPGVWLASGRNHLLLGDRGKLQLQPCRPHDIHCPSADVLFESLATYGSGTLGILLTGMGDDGAEGLLKLRRAGGRTIAQNEQSSLIYGMPRAAVECGAAEFEFAPTQIAQVLGGVARGTFFD